MDRLVIDGFRRLLRNRRRRSGFARSVDPQLLVALRRAHWRPRRAGRALLIDLEREFRTIRPAAQVMVLTDGRPGPLGQVLAGAFPRMRVHYADVRADADDLHTTLAAWGPYDMIIDDTRRSGLCQPVFVASWYHLQPGGLYVVRTLHPASRPTAGRRHDHKPAERLDHRTLVKWLHPDALGRTRTGHGYLIMENRAVAYAKMRESQMNDVIKTRRDGRAELIKQLPFQRFTSRARLDPPELLDDAGRYKINFTPPPMSVRSYRDALVHPRQVALQRNLVLPESYRHNQRPRLSNRGMRNLSRYFATVEPSEPVRRLSGTYFHLDAEWRQHYGHLLTEQLSRLWAWPELKQQLPGVKVLLSLQRGHHRPERWEQAIFTAAGICPDDVVIIDGPTRVEQLIGATPMLSMPDYVDPRIGALWDRVGDALVTGAPADGRRIDDGPFDGHPGGEPIFVTRPPDSKTRRCHNQVEVEEYFRSHGFRVVQPELYPVADQVRLFREASAVAGFGGSAMFNLMFRREPVPVLLLRPTSYTSVNEYLISAIRGNQLSMIDSVPDIDHPPGRWTWKAFYSGFTFDFSREGRRLEQLLDACRQRKT